MPDENARRRCREPTLQLASRGCRRLLRQAARRSRCRRASGRRWRNAPLTHGFDLAALLAVPITDDEAWWPASSLLAHRSARRHAAHRRADRRRSAAVIEALDAAARPARRATATPPTSSSRSRTTAAHGCASATTRNGKRPDPGTELHGDLPRRQRRRRQRRRRRHRPYRQRRRAARSTRSRNPMPAAGGVEPEDIEAARRDAPAGVPHPGARGHRRRLRGGGRAPRRRAARRRHVPLDRQLVHGVRHAPTASAAPRSTRAFATQLRRHLERFRMAGYDLEVDAPRYVPLDVALHICVQPDYFRADVLQRGRAGAVERRAARRPASACSIPTISRSASRSISAASSPPRRRSRASMRCAPKFQRLVDPSRDLARRRRDPDRRPGDRPARQQPELSASAAGSR